jgi:hypothetical protein
MDGEGRKAEPVVISAPPSGQVTIDAQNPLPEPSFFWRRVLAYVVVLAVLVLTGFALDTLHDLQDSAAVLNLAKWTLGFAAMIATYYYIAPSAAELTNIIQSAKIIKGSINIAGKTAENGRGPASQRDSAPRTPPRQGPSGKRIEAAPERDYAPFPKSKG